jgi:hypothetical protein
MRLGQPRIRGKHFHPCGCFRGARGRAEDQVKGQVALAFVVLKRAQAAATPEGKKALKKEIKGVVDSRWGVVANPARAVDRPAAGD